jgi:hypothetical protein
VFICGLKKSQKSHFFVSGKQNYFPESFKVGACKQIASVAQATFHWNAATNEHDQPSAGYLPFANCHLPHCRVDLSHRNLMKAEAQPRRKPGAGALVAPKLDEGGTPRASRKIKQDPTCQNQTKERRNKIK